ncbi:GFA family protein [Chitinimonas sp.]|uniref:GFA family protein n=1 Tax=Chitinimonas sp. TaxID=1934313 RepID=UPI0035B113A8
MSGQPRMNGVCHCQNCQRRTGSAFGRSMYFPKASVVEISGETLVYAFHHQAQNHDQRRHFCARCGTTLFWYVSTLPELIGIAGGCFAGEDLPAPDYSVSHANKAAWLQLPEGWHTRD